MLVQVSDSFPFEWIKKKWREGFHVTAMATAGPQWAVVMSRNAGFQAQCVELDFQYSSEGIHRRWDEGALRSSNHNPVWRNIHPDERPARGRHEAARSRFLVAH